MNNRQVVALAVAAALVWVAPLSVAGQTRGASGESTRLSTAWGAPDIQGIWDFRTLTPLERPDALAGKEFLTNEEAAAFELDTLKDRDMDRRDGAEIEAGIGSDVERAYNQFWWDFGSELSAGLRTSLITDPPDGKIPWTAAARARMAGFYEDYFGTVASGPEDRGLAERCILGFNSGPPMLPSAYNNNVQLLQTPDHVVIFNEMVHNARIVPLNGQPLPSGDVRQWVGASRGHWDGPTLVVETTNFLGETGFQGSSAQLRLVERFTRADADTLVYEFTVEDPLTWARPWTAAVPMAKSEGPLFEYACHEGNYGMEGILAGARATDNAVGKTGQSAR